MNEIGLLGYTLGKLVLLASILALHVPGYIFSRFCGQYQDQNCMKHALLFFVLQSLDILTRIMP